MSWQHIHECRTSDPNLPTAHGAQSYPPNNPPYGDDFHVIDHINPKEIEDFSASYPIIHRVAVDTRKSVRTTNASTDPSVDSTLTVFMISSIKDIYIDSRLGCNSSHCDLFGVHVDLIRGSEAVPGSWAGILQQSLARSGDTLRDNLLKSGCMKVYETNEVTDGLASGDFGYLHGLLLLMLPNITSLTLIHFDIYAETFLLIMKKVVCSSIGADSPSKTPERFP